MSRALGHFDKTGTVAIASKTWPDILAGETGTAEKFWIQNTGDIDLGTTPLALVADLQAVGDSDGVTRLRWGLDTGSIGPPFSAAVAEVTGSGVWSTTGTVYYRLTAINAAGESQGSQELAATVTDAGKVQALSWTLPAGATGVKVYRSTTPGVYTSPALVATVGAVTSYTDTGTATGTGALPAANTTGGAGPAYGTAPTLGTATLNFGTLRIGEARAYWVNRVIPPASTESGNDRIARRHFAEV